MSAAALLAALALWAAPGEAPDAPGTRPAPPPPLAAVPRRPARPRAIQQRLPNGLRVVVVEYHRRPLVIARLHLPSGSATEAAALGGSTWLAVHLLTDYREQDARGDTLAGERSFRRQVADAGGAVHAEVGPDQSVLEISGYALDAGRYLDLLAAAVLDPRHGQESFRGRRSGLLDHLEDLDATSPGALERMVLEASFASGHPYARSSAGTLETLTPLGLEDVVARQEEILSPRGATLVVVGDVSTAEILARVRRAFGAWERGAPPGPGATPKEAPQARAGVGLLRREPASTLLVCAARSLGDVRGQDAALGVLAAILGDGAESRLMSRLREGSGLSYAAGATVERYRLARAFRACARVAADRGGEGIGTVRAVLEELRAAPPPDAEVDRARARCLAELDGAWDSAAGIAGAWTDALGRGEPYPDPDAERAALEAVRAADVATVARAALEPRRLRWIVSGDARAATRATEANRMGPVVPVKLGR